MSLTAVTTMLKMMKNMSTNFKEDKFKRIRLGNANFNSKVGGIDGGLEVGRAGCLRQVTAAVSILGFRVEELGEPASQSQ